MKHIHSHIYLIIFIQTSLCPKTNCTMVMARNVDRVTYSFWGVKVKSQQANFTRVWHMLWEGRYNPKCNGSMYGGPGKASWRKRPASGGEKYGSIYLGNKKEESFLSRKKYIFINLDEINMKLYLGNSQSSVTTA